jgi:uncharacterized metal-binding protein YceD (DUF177 family)
MTPEFSRRISVDVIGAGGYKVGISASTEECAALTKRFEWIAIEGLSANAQLLARAGGIDALGTFEASIERACVATGEPVRERVEEAFAIHFVRPENDLPIVDEVELAENDLDTVEFDGAAVDIGEAVAQSLALAVAPFPRSPAAEAELKEAGVLSEADAVTGPFAGLKGLLKG